MENVSVDPMTRPRARLSRQLIPLGIVRNDLIQTPIEVARHLVSYFRPTGTILEPCKGEGNFLRALPPDTQWCEALEGRDFFAWRQPVDWIITNPPYSQFRAFHRHAMTVADNIVFLTTINHYWLKARLRDMRNADFGFREIRLLHTPSTFPSSGFQIGAVYTQRQWHGQMVVSHA